MREVLFFLLFLLVHQIPTASPQGCSSQPLDYLSCPQIWMRPGNQMECKCKKNCRPIILTCLNNGRMKSTNFNPLLYCSGGYKNEELTLFPGKKIKLSFVNNKYTLNCINSLTIKAGSGSCKPIGFFVTKNPVCRQPGNKGHTTPRLPGGCKAFEFRCNDGKCIDLYLRCDGERDCTDGSDEHLCGTKQTLAFPERFRCRNNVRSLLLNTRCDGTWQCPDKSDEQECSPGVCGVHQYRCANGICIPGSNVCDGANDCGDSSDEIYCSRLAKRGSCPAWKVFCNIKGCTTQNFGCTAEVCTNPNSPQTQMCKLKDKCKHNEGQCGNSRCIDHSYFCDGRNDCGDYSDERNCGTPTVCPRNELPCDNGMCVPMLAKCDGINHCGDGSDEWGCPKPPGGCKQCEFSCVRTGQCVPWAALCDGLFHCTDGSDEWADACKANIPAGCSEMIVFGLSSTTSGAVAGTVLLLFFILGIAVRMRCYRKDRRTFAMMVQNVSDEHDSASTSDTPQYRRF